MSDTFVCGVRENERPGNALNNSRSDEVILLPNSLKSRNAIASREDDRTGTSKPSLILQAFPNPSAGPVYLVLDIPKEAIDAEIEYQDALGRTILTTRTRPGSSIAEVQTAGWPNGVYTAVLRWGSVFQEALRFSVAH